MEVSSGNKTRVVFGGQDGGHWYLSKFDKGVAGRAKNQYDSQEAAEAQARARGLTVQWED